MTSSTTIYDSGQPDPVSPSAREVPVQELPHETLKYLINSRYCEVDRFSMIALELFGNVAPGWSRVQAVCDWVHSRVTFGYQHARPTKTALDVYTERVGVCRDFQHLAVTLCRALNIPARYVTGYLGDIGVPGRSVAHGFQRVVSGLSRRPLVDLRRPPQLPAHRPRADGDGSRRLRCGHDDFIRSR